MVSESDTAQLAQTLLAQAQFASSPGLTQAQLQQSWSEHPQLAQFEQAQLAQSEQPQLTQHDSTAALIGLPTYVRSWVDK